MPDLVLGIAMVGGRLSIDFANLPSRPASGPSNGLSWEELIGFLRVARIVSPERAEELLGLTEADPQAAFDLLNRAWAQAKARGEKLPPIEQKSIPPEVPGQQ